MQQIYGFVVNIGMSHSTRNKDLPEKRRRAIELALAGAKRGQICKELDLVPSTAWRWIKEYKESGDAVFDKRLGRPSRLSEEDIGKIVDRLTLGPEANGYDTALWTLSRIADVIRDTTGIQYNPNYVAVLMHGLGWSCQKPERRARERNEEAIAGWVAGTWPELKKSL